MNSVRSTRLGVVKFTSCSGCVLQVLIALAATGPFRNLFEIAYFKELGIVDSGPYDVLLVEGSVSTQRQVEELEKLRSQAEFLVAVGTCAIQGGVQALRAGCDLEMVKSSVYPSPEHVDVLPEPAPLSDYVRVDYAVPGCPVEASFVARFLVKVALGGLPIELYESVCADCKRSGFECVLVARGEPCLGPITRGSCGALCPSSGRGCYGCFSVKSVDVDSSRLAWFKKVLESMGLDPGLFETLLKAYSYGMQRKN